MTYAIAAAQYTALDDVSRTYDAIFARHAGAIPVNYLRALAYRESSLNPRETGGSYWGLLQVGLNNVLPSYNARHGTNYTGSDLLNPDVNVKIAADLLNRIAVAYAKHPSANMKPNWHNPEFVKLLTAGWNSGYSESGGVGRVATYLEQRSIPVTHDNVFTYAAAAGATKHLSNPTKHQWQRSVADLFYKEGGPGLAPYVTVGIAIFVGWGLYKLATRK